MHGPETDVERRHAEVIFAIQHRDDVLRAADALAAAVERYDGTIVTRQSMFDAARRYREARL